MNKRITIKKIMLMLYALLMCLPLIQVGFRCAYVALNKNAYESYYGETINQETITYITYNDLEIGNIYYLSAEKLPEGTTGESGGNGQRIYVSNVKNISTNENISNATSLAVYSYNQNVYINLFDDNNTSTYSINSTTGGTLRYELVSKNFNTSSINLFNNLPSYYKTYNNYSYLDNAFDYSLHEFIENNNTGLIDFIGLFSGMFLGTSNVVNSLYLGFANFMMNYALFVSCAYFVFEVLMWFINYCRKWLYAFEEKGGAE